MLINKKRTLMVLLAIYIGIFGFLVVATSYVILLREMDKNYLITNPAAAILSTEIIDSPSLNKIKELPYIEDVEKRNKVIGRIETGENEWKDIWLFIIDDIKSLKINKFFSEEGAKLPGRKEIFLERAALSIVNKSIGDNIKAKIPEEKQLPWHCPEHFMPLALPPHGWKVMLMDL